MTNMMFQCYDPSSSLQSVRWLRELATCGCLEAQVNNVAVYFIVVRLLRNQSVQNAESLDSVTVTWLLGCWRINRVGKTGCQVTL